LAAGGEYTAGDAQDKLNSRVIMASEAWKTAWKGKTHQAIKMLERTFPGQRITALAIAGGPACDWERKELRDTFCTQYPALVLKQLGDLDDFQAWLAREYDGGGSTQSRVPHDEAAIIEALRRANMNLQAHQEPATPSSGRWGSALQDLVVHPRSTTQNRSVGAPPGNTNY
jgi:hypothetical protein